MSLTLFLKIPAIAKSLIERYPLPSTTMEEKQLAAPSLTTEYGLTGTAADYVLRAILERVYSNICEIHRNTWIAELAIAKAPPLFQNMLLGYLDRGRNAHRQFLLDGRLSPEFVKSMCHLARIDPIYRVGEGLGGVPYVSEKVIEDVSAIGRVFDPRMFRGAVRLELNPQFGKASRLVKGADADLIVGFANNKNLLVDFKTTKEFQFKTDYWIQLVGYSLLRSIQMDKPQITHAGIYFARHGHLQVMPLDVTDGEDFDDFLGWFQSMTDGYRDNPNFGIEPRESSSTRKRIRRKKVSD